MIRFQVCVQVAAMAGVTLLGGCAPAAGDSEAARAALMQTSREWAQAAATDDIERIVSYWADDAIVMAPDQPAIVGKAAIREFVTASQQIPGFSISWEPQSATIADSGDLGYLVERNRTTFTDATGALQTQEGKTVTVWRKDASGAWKCVIDIWNNNPEGVATTAP